MSSVISMPLPARSASLLVHLGLSGSCGGTDAIWYGSPHGQIDAFRTFVMGEAFQERDGYRALTDATRALILGANAQAPVRPAMRSGVPTVVLTARHDGASITSELKGDTMDIVGRYQRALKEFGAKVHAVGEHQWHEPTPCSAWDVRELVNHLVYENRWAVELLAGKTVDEVGARFHGDLLGGDPGGRWDDSASAAVAAIEAPGAMERTVHLSFGDFSGAEYAEQLFADLLVHAWDLARAVGADEALDAGLVAACSRWFSGWEDGYRGAGVVGPRVASDATDPAGELLIAFGRNPSTDDTLSVIRRFNDAFNRHDVPVVMALMSHDCVFEDTTPPHGRRHVGQAEVQAAWEALFASSPTARFETEDGIIAGDRATYRWCYHFDGGSVRGVDLFHVRDGRVAEKLAYVKG